MGICHKSCGTNGCSKEFDETIGIPELSVMLEGDPSCPGDPMSFSQESEFAGENGWSRWFAPLNSYLRLVHAFLRLK